MILMLSRLPRIIRFLLVLLAAELILFTLFRLGFLFAFKHLDLDHTVGDLLYGLWVGFRFDLQLAVLLLLPIYLTGGIKHIGIFRSQIAKYFWLSYLILTNFLIIALYVINFAYYDFFKKPVDNSIIRYFYDFGEAFKMVKDDYPIFSVTLITLISLGIIFRLLLSLVKRIDRGEERYTLRQKVTIYTLFSVLYLFGGYGKLELYPWRWSEAFFSSNNFISYLSSNPVTYFINTLKNNDVRYEMEKVKKYYPYVAEYVGIDPKDHNSSDLVRVIKPDHAPEYSFDKPNIVFILGESTSYSRSSISGNPLDPTPYLKYMSDNGLTYSRYYTPHIGTARSVWASVTGLADIERMKTSSRNPMIVQQNMILNSLKDYKKFYFIGGSLSWGNVRGVLGNIDGIVTREEASYKSPRNDVWGISDAHLVGEVNDVLRQQTQPFFAYVQFASNHSPNTIPEENFGYVRPEKHSKETLLKYSFDGKENELLGQTFQDHSLKRFIELAKKEKYFDNTIFIFVGDHGLPRRADHMEKSEESLELAAVHTPLVIYAPKLIKHKEIDYPVSEVDIMATIAGLTGTEYLNTTYGRDILDKDFGSQQHYAFFMNYDTNPQISLAGEKYLFTMRVDGKEKALYEYSFKGKPENLIAKSPEEAKKMEDVLMGIYESTRYIRYHNSKGAIEKFIHEKDANSSDL